MIVNFIFDIIVNFIFDIIFSFISDIIVNFIFDMDLVQNHTGFSLLQWVTRHVSNERRHSVTMCEKHVPNERRHSVTTCNMSRKLHKTSKLDSQILQNWSLKSFKIGVSNPSKKNLERSIFQLDFLMFYVLHFLDCWLFI